MLACADKTPTHTAHTHIPIAEQITSGEGVKEGEKRRERRGQEEGDLASVLWPCSSR